MCKKALVGLAIGICCLIGQDVKARNQIPDSPLPVSEKSWGSLLKERLRIQNYSEIMTPSLGGPLIPGPDGEGLAPASVDGRVWVDYALTQKFRLLYWQRYFIFPFNDYSIYDPRIGVRLLEIFDIPGLSTTYDFYFLPGISAMAQQANRVLEVGVRTNNTYLIPHSSWTLGMVTEMNADFYDGFNSGKSLWGVLAPWTSYKLSNHFSTQHWFVFPAKYEKGSLVWDATGMPFVQNGIGWNASESVWIGAFLNNYLFTSPTFQNTWASIWLNFTFI